MSDDPYHRSLLRAVRTNGLLRPFVRVLSTLPHAATGLVASDVMALTGARVEEHYSRNDVFLFASTLVLRGYGLDMAQSIVQQLYQKYPTFSPESCMLMPRGMLLDEFGSALGTVLADTLTDPKEQPVLHALLFDNRVGHLQVAERRAGSMIFEAALDGREIREIQSKGVPAYNSAVTWGIRDQQPLRTDEALYTYEQVTDGCRLSRIIHINCEELLRPWHAN